MSILTLQKRIKEVGRIRLGMKGPKGNPTKLTVFRLTSFDRRAIEKAAEIYGGTVKPCEDKDLKGQWEVVSERSEIPFFVSPTPPSQYMELWSGGGCQRRCDGKEELLSGKPCMCTPGSEECKPTTRLPVILPDLPGLGVWRLESKGWNAAVELIPTFEFLQKMAGAGNHIQALLALEERTGRVDGKTTRFMVPVIRTEFTPRQIMEGNLPLATPSAPELPATTHETDQHALKQPNPRGAVFALLHEMGLPPHEDEHKAMYYRVFGKALGREVTSLSALDDGDWTAMAMLIDGIKAGTKAMPKEWKDHIDARDARENLNPFTGEPE